MPAFFRQEVNQWMCIALIALMCFWTVLYYITHKALNTANTSVASFSEIEF